MSGVVVDKRDKPVAGAVVIVGGSEAVTEDNGEFTVNGVGAGLLDVMVIAVDYETHFGQTRAGATLRIRLTAGGDNEIISIKGEVPREPNSHSISVEEVRTLPATGNDVLRSLQNFPGVARTPLGLGGLALRGSAPRDTKVYLDDIEVPLLYHFGGISSFVPTAFIKDLTIEPSGFGARYGRAIGGVAMLNSKAGRTDKWRAGGEISLLHGSAYAEGPGPKKSNVMFAVRRSYLDAVIGAFPLDFTLLPRYMDGQARWQSPSGALTALVFASDDRLALQRDPNTMSAGGIEASDVKSFDYRSRFFRASLRYLLRRKSATLTLQPWVGMDQVRAFANHKDIDKGVERIAKPIALRATVQGPVLGGNLAGGFDGKVTHYTYDLNSTPPTGPDGMVGDVVLRRTGDLVAKDLGWWLEGNWATDKGLLSIKPGLRVDYFEFTNRWYVDPRITVTEDIARDVRVIQSIGLYHQPPSVVDLDPIFGDRTMLAGASLQTTLGVRVDLGNGNDVSATAYYQKMTDLTADVVTGATPISANGSSQAGGLLSISREVIDDQFGSYTYRESIGQGKAYGVELMARRQTGRLTGWLIYTFARSFRRGDPRTMLTYAPYVLDQPHMFTALASFKLNSKWKFGGKIRAATGNPYTPVVGAFPSGVEDQWTAIDGPLLSERLPAFFQIDVRVDRQWQSKRGTFALFLDVQNATYRSNVEGLTYSIDYKDKFFSYGIPIFPSLGVEFIPR